MSKVVLVVGSSGGIGNATVREFRKHEFKVVGVDQKASKLDLPDIFIQGEVTDENLWIEVASSIKKEFGQLDVLVNLAGRNYYSLIDESDINQWRNMLDVNVLGMVLAIKNLVPLLKVSNDPAIINMSSISGYIGSVGYAAYCTSKGAVDSLTKSLALELAPKIRVNAIAPGWIETPFTVEGLEKSEDPVKYRKDVETMHALNRVGMPEEIAKSIYWMSSPESSFMTGSVVIVDGGYMIKN
jgi:NAD(P)-dependent dehydrogenase (short-subunit alcohol dehydrogenase family)